MPVSSNICPSLYSEFLQSINKCIVSLLGNSFDKNWCKSFIFKVFTNNCYFYQFTYTSSQTLCISISLDFHRDRLHSAFAGRRWKNNTRICISANQDELLNCSPIWNVNTPVLKFIMKLCEVSVSPVDCIFILGHSIQSNTSVNSVCDVTE